MTNELSKVVSHSTRAHVFAAVYVVGGFTQVNAHELGVEHPQHIVSDLKLSDAFWRLDLRTRRWSLMRPLARERQSERASAAAAAASASTSCSPSSSSNLSDAVAGHSPSPPPPPPPPPPPHAQPLPPQQPLVQNPLPGVNPVGDAVVLQAHPLERDLKVYKSNWDLPGPAYFHSAAVSPVRVVSQLLYFVSRLYIRTQQ